MKDVVIRDTTLDDVPKLRAMHGASWRKTYPNKEHGISQEWVDAHTFAWVTPEELEKSKEYFKGVFGNPSHLHKVAIYNAEVVGFIHVIENEEKYYLGAFYVDEQFHGTGLAQRLMEIILQWTGSQKPIYLEVVAYNERAKAFYRKYNFSEVPGTEALLAEKIPDITMIRKGEKS